MGLEKSLYYFLVVASIIFFLSATLSSWLFILIAKNWLKLNEKWLSVEYFMRHYSYQPNIERRFKITTGIIMLLALGEHILAVFKLAHKTNLCPLARTDPVKAYFGVAFSPLFTYVPYSGWFSFFMEIIIITSTFTWNFNDLFIILICSALAERFRQINRRIINSEDKNEKFWKEIREDYTRLSTLCKSLNNVICHVVTMAFGNDVFFICLQLFHTLKPLDGIIETIYFVCSFGFLLGRTAALFAYCCWINDESKITLTHLYNIPTQDFGTEARRLIQQISFCPGVITGSNYFEVTRGFCLQIVGAIITFELILFQVGPMLVKTDNNANLFCVN